MKICIYDVSNYDIADIIKKILDKWAVDLVHINNCCHCQRVEQVVAPLQSSASSTGCFASRHIFRHCP